MSNDLSTPCDGCDAPAGQPCDISRCPYWEAAAKGEEYDPAR
jgi:hypothetical protein